VGVDFFKPGDSVLHRYDPRAKLLLLAPLFVFFFLPIPLWVSALYVVSLAALIAAALGIPELAIPLRAIAPVLALILLLTPPFHRGGRIILRVFSLSILTQEGFRETAVILIRFTGISLSFFAVFRSIELDDLVLALRWFGVPYSLCLAVIIAFRYIPSLGVTYRNVIDAHRLREGSLPVRGSRRRRSLASYLPVLTSVLIQAVKGIPVLAMVLESRGFGRSNRRSSYAELKKGWALAVDFLVCIGVTALLLAPVFFPWLL